MSWNVFKKVLIMGCLGLISALSYAADASSAQALEQLRFLQQKMSNNAPNMVPDDRATPLSPNPKSGQRSSATTAQATPVKSAPAPVPAETVPALPPANFLSTEDEAKGIDDLAFTGVKAQLFPLEPDKIHDLKETYEENEFAKAASADTPPKPTATSQFVNLSPGSTPPVIRLSHGFVSSLVFLDSTGAPWPISAYDLGDPNSFNIQWDKTGNTLMIQAMKLYTYGNLAVRLTGLNTPVMLTLIPGQKAVDYRVDLRVQGFGPNATMPMEAGLPPSANDALLHVLDGVPPPGSVRLVVSGGDARAWLLDNKMFVRTNLTILSPGWMGSMTSADGMHAYEIQKSPVLLVSWHGKVMQLKIEGL